MSQFTTLESHKSLESFGGRAGNFLGEGHFLSLRAARIHFYNHMRHGILPH